MTTHELSLDRALRAIADPTRRRILEALKQRGINGLPARSHSRQNPHSLTKESQKCAGLCAGDIEQRVKVSQPTISHHMAILTKAGLVETVKEGQWRWYRRNEKIIRQMIMGLRAKL